MIKRSLAKSRPSPWWACFPGKVGREQRHSALPVHGAALMLYTALNFMGEVVTHEDGTTETAADPSYDDLHEATGLSRALISAGMGVLRDMRLVQSEGSSQRRKYRILWDGGSWFKLPCRAIIDGTCRGITPFNAFNLRSRYELHAMKLYLYIASCRDNITPYSMVSFERIYERTGIPERDVVKAYSLLIGSKLLAGIDRDYSDTLRRNESNKYYLTGYQDLKQRS